MEELEKYKLDLAETILGYTLKGDHDKVRMSAVIATRRGCTTEEFDVKDDASIARMHEIIQSYITQLLNRQGLDDANITDSMPSIITAEEARQILEGTLDNPDRDMFPDAVLKRLAAGDTILAT